MELNTLTLIGVVSIWIILIYLGIRIMCKLSDIEETIMDLKYGRKN